MAQMRSPPRISIGFTRSTTRRVDATGATSTTEGSTAHSKPASRARVAWLSALASNRSGGAAESVRCPRLDASRR